MRIPSSVLYKRALLDINHHQGDIAKVQQQISSGKKILKPSDDPTGAARSLGIHDGIERLKQYNENGNFANQRLGLEDATLNSVTQTLHRVRELAIQANTDVQSPQTRLAVRSELEERLKELVAYGNTRDANGDYLFSGFKGDTQPFTFTATGVQYNGDQGQPFLQIGTTQQVASGDSGFAVFEQIKNGNGRFVVENNSANSGSGVITAGTVVDSAGYRPENYSIQFSSDTIFDVVNTTTGAAELTGQTYVDGAAINFNGLKTSITGDPATGDEFIVTPSRTQGVFETLSNFIRAMEKNPEDDAQSAQLHQSLHNAVGDVDLALQHILEVRAGIGARQNSVSTAEFENEAVQFQLTETLSEIQDLDYAEAISRLEFQLTTLEAAQKTFSRIEGLSLFDYLR